MALKLLESPCEPVLACPLVEAPVITLPGELSRGRNR